MSNGTQAATAAPPDPQVLRQFFAEAAIAVGALADEATRTSSLFRRFDLNAANEALAVFPAELRNFIVMVQVVSGQLGVADAELRVDELTPAQQITRLGTWLESLVDAQKNQDALTIADILEYDLEPFLSSWRKLLAERMAA